MAVYKVAQDVEADDKLIGPFSFRQFVYLIIVAIAIALGWGLSQIFVGLAIIPLPIILFFGALALPLRKDQPMEIYMAAILSYYLKPRKRFWVPDGIESLVEITAPKVIEVQRMKDLSQTEAERRLSYLADIADTQGWAIRHTAMPAADNSMNTDVFYAAQQTEDVLDDNAGIAQSINAMIGNADERRRQEMVNMMQNPAAARPATNVPPISDPYASLSSGVADEPTQGEQDLSVNYDPYPTEIHQMVINPLGSHGKLNKPAPHKQSSSNTATSTSENRVSPDIINLASNPDLSIETIQREANRIQKKHDAMDSGEEVVISLR